MVHPDVLMSLRSDQLLQAQARVVLHASSSKGKRPGAAHRTPTMVCDNLCFITPWCCGGRPPYSGTRTGWVQDWSWEEPTGEQRLSA